VNATDKRRRRYSALTSIAAVQAERKRLGRLKSTNELYLAEDWDEIRYELSPENLLSRAMCRWPVASSIMTGIKAVTALFGKR
jgi:hypothetical protein